MITDAILSSLHTLAAGMWSLMPAWNLTLSADQQARIAAAQTVYGQVDVLAPVHELLECFGITVVIGVAMIGWHVLQWWFRRVVDVIP